MSEKTKKDAEVEIEPLGDDELEGVAGGSSDSCCCTTGGSNCSNPILE